VGLARFLRRARDAPDKTYSRWGGFIDDVAFDPIEFGMPPNSLSSIDPLQLLALRPRRTHWQTQDIPSAVSTEAEHP